MNNRIPKSLPALFGVVCSLLLACRAQAQVQRYSVVELQFQPPGAAPYGNPWEDATLTVTFQPPAGAAVVVGGFYYGGVSDWRARLAPWLPGRWTWQSSFTDRNGAMASASGAFDVVDAGPGFVLQQSRAQSGGEPDQWVFSDGKPYFPLGLGDCFYPDPSAPGSSPLEYMGFDGGLYANRPASQGWRVDLDTYLNAHAAAGFNLFRVSNNNCTAFSLFKTVAEAGNIYDAAGSAWTDELVRRLRLKGFRVFFEMSGFSPPFRDESALNPGQKEALRRFARYVVDRWGAYVDFWEMMNEATPKDLGWYDVVSQAIRLRDPYGHLISTSWEAPENGNVDIIGPHAYEAENELESDAFIPRRVESVRKAGNTRPVIFGEQGNYGWSWSDRSAVRMRLRTWGALFGRATLIFWNESAFKDGGYKGAGNQYVGPEERDMVARWRAFASRIPANVHKATDAELRDVSRPLRAVGLLGPTATFLYVTNTQRHDAPTSGGTLKLQFPSAGTAHWVDPLTGASLGDVGVSAGLNTLQIPTFITDAALWFAQ
jgi:hypothetical protein